MWGVHGFQALKYYNFINDIVLLFKMYLISTIQINVSVLIVYKLWFNLQREKVHTSQFGSISLISFGPTKRKSFTPFSFPRVNRPSNLGISSWSTATINWKSKYQTFTDILWKHTTCRIRWSLLVVCIYYNPSILYYTRSNLRVISLITFTSLVHEIEMQYHKLF